MNEALSTQGKTVAQIIRLGGGATRTQSNAARQFKHFVPQKGNAHAWVIPLFVGGLIAAVAFALFTPHGP